MVSLDKVSIDINCPNCGFFNSIFIKQARLEDVIICRGCKYNIHLSDQMAECQKAIKRINKQLIELTESIQSFSSIK